MVLSFLLTVFSISVCHCLKSVVYEKVCVCVRVCVCAMQNVSKIKNLLSLERAAGGHQKATESEARTHIRNTLKI